MSKAEETVREPLSDAGLRILADVAGYLAAGLGTEDVLTRVAGVLARGLDSEECRVWVRTADGTGFRAIVGEGVTAPGDRSAEEVAGWLSAQEPVQREGDGWRLRYPLHFEGERLGALEATVRDDAGATALKSVVGM